MGLIRGSLREISRDHFHQRFRRGGNGVVKDWRCIAVAVEDLQQTTIEEKGDFIFWLSGVLRVNGSARIDVWI